MSKANTLGLYFSKKLNPFIGKEFFNLASQVNEPIADEFYLWYGDVFDVNRKKYLIFSNGLTKFSFVVLDYRVDKKTNFYNTFSTYLSHSLRHNGFNPDIYFENIEFYTHNSQTSRSAMSHLSQLKDLCAEVIAVEDYILYKKEELEYLNHYVNSWITSYKDRKGYHEPNQVFKEECVNRGMLADRERSF
ncbi:DUF6933 domain-containing protein [Anditalea andensis]|uniref:DUF6933 domain-containing protein n=1 Tax=Anditalea andensis TaxID=1048983 RepID=A0A074L3S4_9BACT|nr:hypothetical protein [Anditalea andensis]KEO75849.1 hypothetical protein EL17_22775 [Anditalea andensis]